eukprot:scaffold119_cov245-Chaetoceros_neogracile.AAC.1
MPTPSKPVTSKHAMIEASASPSNRHSRIKQQPVTYGEDFDDSLIGEVSGSKRRRSLDFCINLESREENPFSRERTSSYPTSNVLTDTTSMLPSMISLDRILFLSAITPLQSIVRGEFKCPMKTVLDAIQILEILIGANDGTVKVSNSVDRLRKIGGTGEPSKLPPPYPCPPCSPPHPDAQVAKTAILNNNNRETRISIAKSAVTPSSITIPKTLAVPVMNTKGVNHNPFVSQLEEIKKGLPPIYTPNEDRIAGLTAIGFDFNFPKDCNGKLSNAKGTSNDREVLVAATIASTENNSNDAVAPAVKCTAVKYRPCDERSRGSQPRAKNGIIEGLLNVFLADRRKGNRPESSRCPKRSCFLQGPCSKEKGSVSSMGADIAPRNAGNGKTHNMPTKVGTTK